MFSVKIRKAIAAFLLAVFVNSVVTPTISYALTAGPSSPEFSSFEPVDTTDLVNLATGDLVYNMPLLEVPGPEGGYPISLSYHSGILLNEEASWVGLGFTLNPGAINRTVNATPDDHYANTRTVRDYNHGGERNKFSIGVGVPGANFGLSVSHDTNLGWGVGHSAGIDLPYRNVTSSVGIKAGARIEYDPFGGNSGFVGVSAVHAKGLSARVGISTNFNTVAFNTGIGYKQLTAGASLSSKGVSPSFSIAGSSFQQVNSNAGKISTYGVDMEVPIVFPNGLVLTLGYNYLRYYSDESSEVKVIGSLFAKETKDKNPDEWTFDSYSLLDPDAAGGVVINNDPEKSRGGSFPAYDFYNVNAQGLNGSIQPYIFDNGTLFRQNVKKQGSNDYVVKYSPMNGSFNFHKPVNFRFKNDFSNTHSYGKTEMRIEDDGTVRFVNNKNPIPLEGFNTGENHLAGSKHIQWFTNEQVNGDLARIHGLMNYHDYFTKSNPQARRGDAWARGADVSNQVGAYMITNETGVTYHYSLPVYSFDEYLKVQDINDEGKFHEESNPQPYAYTWLLTAITGPDFVDRNENGYVDESDWGYWVRFDYGRRSENYEWRNPGRGFTVDIDNETKFYSRGKKEVYYLNEISTRTHTAFFTKEERIDSKSAVLPDENGGQFIPVKKVEADPRTGRFDITRYYKPQSLLKLSKIYVVENNEAIKLGLFEYRSDEQQITLRGDRILAITDRCLTNQFDQKLVQLSQAAIRAIDFEMSYDLCDNTENSFDVLFDNENNPVVDTLQYDLRGKLTLNAVKFIGSGGSSFLPKTTFSYGKNESYQRNYYDMWGFYKSDFRSAGYENLSRYVSNESSQKVDAWCLTGISSPLGSNINIEYESDSYKLPELYKSYPFPVKAFTININKQGYVNLFVDDKIKSDLSYFFSIGEDIRFLAYQLRLYFDLASNSQCTTPGFDYHIEEYSTKITRVFDDHLEVAVQPLYDVMKQNLDEKNTSVTIDFQNYDGPLKSSCPGAFTSVERKFDIQRSVSGNILVAKKLGKVGGGTRVKSIRVDNGDTESRSTNYQYHIPGTDLTSGTVSYEPTGLDLVNFNDRDFFTTEELKNSFIKHNAKKLEAAKTDYFGRFHGNFSKLLATSREVPSPSVIYQFVTVTETTQKGNDVFQVPGKKVYEFQTFEEEFINRTRIASESSPYPVRCLDENGHPTDCNWTPDSPREFEPVECFDQDGNPIGCGVKPSNIVSPLTIADYSAWMGAVKETSIYGANDVPLSKTSYEYLHTGKTTAEFNTAIHDLFKSQGVITQLFNENKTSGKVYSRKDEYPLVPTGKKQVNYKTGLTEEVKNLAFDFYTGTPTEVLSTNSYGIRYLALIEPAYKKYPGMGLKVIQPEYRHMLTQTAASYAFKVNEQNQYLGLIGAAVTEWSNTAKLEGSAVPQEGIWREKASYQWNGTMELNDDGTYKISDFIAHPFDWSALSQNASWEKNTEVTLYDQYSHALEATDINGNFSAVRFDPYRTRVIASTMNAAYDETAYSGVEYSDGNTILEGGVDRVDGNPTTIRAHTGRYSLLVPFGGKGFTYTVKSIHANKPYRTSVWVYAPGESETQAELDKIQLYYYTINGTEHTASARLQKNKSKSWYLITLDIIPNGVSDILIGVRNGSTRGVYLDDFRVQPIDAVMTAYVYDSQTGELTYTLDNANFYTHFEYDGTGRLVKTSRELLNFDFGDGKESFRADQIIQETQYNYRKSIH